MTRRGFLWLCGASTAGIYRAKTGLIDLPRQLVLQMAGTCSFCDKDRLEVFGIAGVVGKEARICDECIGLSLDFFDERSDEMERRWLDDVVERVAPKVLAFFAQPGAKEELEAYARTQPAPEPFVPQDFHCSFCDRSRWEGIKLVSGLGCLICDDCAMDAAGLLAASGSRLLVRGRCARIGAVGSIFRLS
ncbi:MAG TPA: ClpX C4-type zinc finger protein [Polyangia bacterium]|jgi:hypothetical protein